MSPEGRRFTLRKADLAMIIMVMTILGTFWSFVKKASAYQNKIEDHEKRIAVIEPAVEDLKETRAAILQHLEDISTDLAVIKRQTR